MQSGADLVQDVDLLLTHPSDEVVSGLLSKIRAELIRMNLVLGSSCSGGLTCPKVLCESLDTDQNVNKNLVEAHSRFRRSTSFYKGVKALDYLGLLFPICHCS